MEGFNPRRVSGTRRIDISLCRQRHCALCALRASFIPDTFLTPRALQDMQTEMQAEIDRSSGLILDPAPLPFMSSRVLSIPPSWFFFVSLSRLPVCFLEPFSKHDDGLIDLLIHSFFFLISSLFLILPFFDCFDCTHVVSCRVCGVRVRTGYDTGNTQLTGSTKNTRESTESTGEKMNSTFSPGDGNRNNTDGGFPGFGGGGGGNGGFRQGGGGGRYQDDDLGPTTRVSVWLLTGASLAFLLMRVYCKVQRHRRLHADDYFSIAAWVSRCFLSLLS